MKHPWTPVLLAALLAANLPGYATHNARQREIPSAAITEELRALKKRFAPDSHLEVYTVGIEPWHGELVLTGEVDQVEARVETLRAAEQLGLKPSDRIRVLPDVTLDEANWGITCLSVANGREEKEHKAELGTQTLMGEVVRVLKRSGRWLYVQSSDQYLSWMESGLLKLCTRAEADAWEQAPLLIVTELERLIHEAPRSDAQPISDVVVGCRVKRTGDAGNWLKVELPDGRSGYLATKSATDYAAWKISRQSNARREVIARSNT